MSLLNSYIGMYIVQAFCHSLIAALIVDRAIYSWEIRSPLIQFRFRLIVLLLPIFSFPFYQIINPNRGTSYFREDTALLDIQRWLTIEIWGKVSIALLLLIIFSLATLIFLLQETLPILKETYNSKGNDTIIKRPAEGSVINKALQSLPVNKPDIFVIEDDHSILFSTSGSNTAIYLSTGLMDTLDEDQIQAALAHEIAHIMRRRSPLIWVIFFARILMFFNPVILIEFRRIIQEDEKICDDIAVSLTQKPLALATTLRKLYHTSGEINPIRLRDISKVKDAIEEYSHNVLIESRINRLEEKRFIYKKEGGEWFKFLLTLVTISIINYFIV